jgi:phage tail-like protein
VPVGARNDPYGGYNFLVEIDGITRAGFQECSGLETSQEAGTYREGADVTLGMRKLPGLVTSSNITLRWGITDDDQLWGWRKTVTEGSVERKNMSIVLLDDAREEKIRWNLVNCWPTRWEGPSLNAQSGDVAIETLEIAHEGIDRA